MDLSSFTVSDHLVSRLLSCLRSRFFVASYLVGHCGVDVGAFPDLVRPVAGGLQHHPELGRHEDRGRVPQRPRILKLDLW